MYIVILNPRTVHSAMVPPPTSACYHEITQKTREKQRRREIGNPVRIYPEREGAAPAEPTPRDKRNVQRFGRRPSLISFPLISGRGTAKGHKDEWALDWQCY